MKKIEKMNRWRKEIKLRKEILNYYGRKSQPNLEGIY